MNEWNIESDKSERPFCQSPVLLAVLLGMARLCPVCALVRFQRSHEMVAVNKCSISLISFKVHPAFWLRTGTHETQSTAGNCNAGSPALNSQNTYPYPFSKTVSLQCSGVTTPCLTYHSSFTIAGNPLFQFKPNWQEFIRIPLFIINFPMKTPPHPPKKNYH